jgi:acyl transferase domain-containing protein
MTGKKELDVTAMNEPDDEPQGTGLEIAVIGMSGSFPGACNIDEFWNNLKNGIESVSFFTGSELLDAGVDPQLLENPDHIKSQGGRMFERDSFDAFFFDYLPDEAMVMDPQVRLFHQHAWEALENAGYPPKVCHPVIGVYAGATPHITWEILTRLAGHSSFSSDLLKNEFMSSRISYKFDLKGPSYNVYTACSTSLVAIHLACQGLLSGECEIALAGGVNTPSATITGTLYQEGMIISKDGHCRAFDADASGTIYGEGIGIIALKSLDEALKDNDYIYAVIKSTAINNDGAAKVGFSAPSVTGQTQVIQTALDASEIQAETIGYVETHGTATVMGDPIEIDALTQAFDTNETNFCAIGSVKTNIGHLGTAAGIAGFIKAVLALKHKLIPPSLHFQIPNPAIDFANSPFYVNTSLSGWKNTHQPLRAAVSSFGMGGTNAHAILEEAPPISLPHRESRYQLIPISAKTPTALEQTAQNLSSQLKNNPATHINDVAFTLQMGRTPFPFRKMLVADHTGHVITALADSASPWVKSLSVKEKKMPIVFMFSGQGSHYINMGLQLYHNMPHFRDTMQRCANILKPILERDILEIVYPGSDNAAIAHAQELLEQTHILQPVTFSFQYAISACLIEWGIRPDAVIGHSLGEYAAACAAGIFSLEDALHLVVTRGRLMQALPTGAMLSVSIGESELSPFLNDSLALAAVNSPRHCAVSGSPGAIEALEQKLTLAGHKCRKLHVSLAMHSKVMDAILPSWTHAVEQVNVSESLFPLISSVTGKPLSQSQAHDPQYWARQVRDTVRFNEAVSFLLANQPKTVIEIGPGNSLTSLVRQNEKFSPQHLLLNVTKHPIEELNDYAFFLENIGELWLGDYPVNWQVGHENRYSRRVPLPGYPFESETFRFSEHIYHRFKELSRYLDQPGIFLPSTPYPDSIPQSTTSISTQITPTTRKHERPEIGTTYVAPTDPTEEMLTQMWQDFFAIDKIGIHDNFFHLGGDSLKMMSLATLLHKRFHINIPVTQFIKNNTIHQLAEYIRSQSQNELTPITPVPQQEYYELSNGQQRLWQVCQSPEACISYNMLTTLSFKGTLNTHALNQALEQLMQRHDSLRTAFVTVDGKPKQIIQQDIQCPIVQQSVDPIDQQLPGLFNRHASTLFDLSRSPLFYIALIDFPDGSQILLLNMHHIIGDGWSIDIFSRELIAFYNGYIEPASSGKEDFESIFPPLLIQYKDYALWHSQTLASGQMDSGQSYWQQKLSGRLPITQFPTDFPRPSIKSYNGKILSYPLDKKLFSRLETFCQQQDVTLYMLLLAIIKMLIYHETKQQDIIIGTQTAGRIHPDLENQIGYYVNLLPLRDTIDPTETFTKFLQKVKQTTTQAFDNQMVPFDHIVRQLKINTPPDRHPLFDITVDLQNYSHSQSTFAHVETISQTHYPIEKIYDTSKFDLIFTFTQAPPGLTMMLQYNTDLYKQSSIQQLNEQFIEFVNSLHD